MIDLVGRGAWLTARNARNQRPLDVAQERGATKLIRYLRPQLQREIPRLEQTQRQFHELIRERAGDLVREHSLHLPELEPLLEVAVPNCGLPYPACTAALRTG